MTILTTQPTTSLSIAPPLNLNDDEALICSIFIEDDRYSVPTVSIVSLRDVSEARAFAERKLRSSSHYLQIEARREDELLFILRQDELG